MTALGRDATSNLLSSAPETGRSSFASRKLPDAIECSRPLCIALNYVESRLAGRHLISNYAGKRRVRA